MAIKKLKKFVVVLTAVVFILFVMQFLLIPFIQKKTYVDTNLEETQIASDPFVLGEYYFNQDSDPAGPYDLRKARQYYERVILENQTENPLVWYQLGRIDFLEGSSLPALDKFNKQLEYHEDTVPNVYYMIGLTHGYYAKEKNDSAHWQKAEEAFTKYLEYDPWSPWARTDLAWIYFSQGKFSEMLLVVDGGLQHHQDHPWLLTMYGLAVRNLGDKVLAQEYFDKAVVSAKTLKVEDWGSAYPGNNPTHWAKGLAEFQSILAFNQSLEI